MWDRSTAATSGGVPVATTSPPPSPPSGPRSMMWSAHLMTSVLCSMTITEWPWSMSSCRAESNRRISWKWRPVVGSSKMKSVPVLVARAMWEASLRRWDSPPERVVTGWPSRR